MTKHLTARRQRIAQEMLDEFGIDKIIVVAGQIMMMKGLIKDGEHGLKEKVLDWISTQDEKGVRLLRRVVKVVGEGEPMAKH